MYYLKNITLFIFVILLNACKSDDFSHSGKFVDQLSNTSLVLGAGSEGTAIVSFAVADGLYIMADKGDDHALLYTELRLEGNEYISIGTPHFSTPVQYQIPGSDYKMKVIAGEFIVEVPIQVSRTSPSMTHTFKGVLFYQACDKVKCFFPKELDVELEVIVE